MTELYLIRHAKPVYPNGLRTCLGCRLDVPLCAEGEAQARRLCECMWGIPLSVVYASPLLRAVQTAEALSRQVIQVSELREMDGGVWDGQPFAVLRRDYPDYFGDAARFTTPPGGETDDAALQRGMAALNQIADQEQGGVAVVTHAGLIRVLLREMDGGAARSAQPYTCINTVRRGADGRWQALRCDESPEEFLERRMREQHG